MSIYSRNDPTQIVRQVAAIISVDGTRNRATALNRQEIAIEVDLSYHVGAVLVTPATGEQWYIRRIASPAGTCWVLDTKIPFNSPETLIPAVEGQHQIGGGTGPLQLHGTQINANGPMRLFAGNSPLPAASTVDEGALAYDADNAVPTYHNGDDWTPLATAAQVQSKYVLPPGGVPTSDLTGTAQAALALAATALQNIPTNSVGATQLQAGAVGSTQLSSGVNSALGLANTALQNLIGSPYDLSLISFGALSSRSAASYGDNPFGIKIQRNCALTSVTYRCITADTTGNLTVQLQKNGSPLVGTTTIIAALNQVTGVTTVFSASCITGDILTVYVTDVGTGPGLGLVADITGVMA